MRVGPPLLARTAANQEWALDFVHDVVECGRAIRVLSVVDAYTRECLALEVDTGFASRRVTRVLEAIMAERGQPGDPLRQRAGVHQPAFSGVGGGAEDRGGPHSTGQADAERASGELSRTAARRVFERELVSESVRRQAQDRRLESGVQRRTSAQQLGLSDADRVCGARTNELWKRRLPKNGQLGKR